MIGRSGRPRHRRRSWTNRTSGPHTPRRRRSARLRSSRRTCRCCIAGSSQRSGSGNRRNSRDRSPDSRTPRRRRWFLPDRRSCRCCNPGPAYRLDRRPHNHLDCSEDRRRPRCSWSAPACRALRTCRRCTEARLGRTALRKPRNVPGRCGGSRTRRRIGSRRCWDRPVLAWAPVGPGRRPERWSRRLRRRWSGVHRPSPRHREPVPG
jgi:hypothetical protein